ncbi:MAG: carboxypeptidase regulatory-like domain-containing protein [Phycisphaerae bacterium]|nr:carboxypeptidase regulatory-like domain-containing protein [Phycisphaerae bacterium]
MAILDLATGQKILDDIVQRPADSFTSVLAAYDAWKVELAAGAENTLAFTENQQFVDVGFPPLEGGQETRVFICSNGLLGFRRAALPYLSNYNINDVGLIPGAIDTPNIYNSWPSSGLLLMPSYVPDYLVLQTGKWAIGAQGAVLYIEWNGWGDTANAAVHAAFRVLPNGAGIEVVCRASTNAPGTAYMQVFVFDERNVVPETLGAQQLIVPAPELTQGQLYYFSSVAPPATSTVSGVVTDAAGLPAARVVRVHDRATGNVLGETMSDASTGEYAIEVTPGGEMQVLFLSDELAEGKLLNDIVHRVMP